MGESRRPARQRSALSHVTAENARLRARVEALQCQLALLQADSRRTEERWRARRDLLDHVGEAVGRMKNPDDFERILQVTADGLAALGMPCAGVGINLIDDTVSPPKVGIYNLIGGRLERLEKPALVDGDAMLRIWRAGEVVYRRDLQRDNPFGERWFLLRQDWAGVRSVVDMRTRQGTVAFNSLSPDAFGEGDLVYLRRLADVIGAGMQRRQDLEALTGQAAALAEKSSLLEAFQRIGQSTLSPLDMDSILHNLAEQVVGTGIFRSLMIALVHEDRALVEVVRSYICIDAAQRVAPGTITQRNRSVEGLTYRLDDANVTATVARTGRMAVLDGWSERFDRRVQGPQDFREPTVSYFIPALRGERVLAVLATGSRPDEKERMLRRIETMQPLLGQVAIALDHARLYRALREERERLAVTLDSIGDGVITVDGAGRIVLLNRVAEALTGWSQAEAAGVRVEEVVRLCGGAPSTPPARGASPGWRQRGRPGPVTLTDRAGGQRLVHSSSAPIHDGEGHTVGLVLVVRDTTRDYRLEQEVRKAQRIESLGLLAGSIAHDFNNILASALVNVSVLRTQLGPGPEAQIAQDIETAMEHARALTKQLLSFTRSSVLTRSASSLAELVRETAGFVLRGSRSTCDFAVAEEVWPVAVDTAQMSQVLQNLILNADQAMPAGGRIRVSLQNVRVTARDAVPLDEGPYVRCSVADEGPGIPPESVERIFDPYFTTKPEGTGLGLTSAYAIVSEHGGWIAVESTPGAGARFVVYLPAAEGPVTPPRT
ncbi:MAG: ATP-binding protein [Candidatus Latescibacterota bacterium]